MGPTPLESEAPDAALQSTGRFAIKVAALSDAALAPASPFPAISATPQGTKTASVPGSERDLRLAMLVHPDMILQASVGPLTVFTLMGAERYLVRKDLGRYVRRQTCPLLHLTLLRACFGAITRRPTGT